MKLVSVHGGHSGDFCGHATDSLADIVQGYISLGYSWVCLTEHMPAPEPRLRAPEDIAQGLSVAQLQKRFDQYFAEARRLQALYQHKIEIMVGFETDAYTGYPEAVDYLIHRHQPDMIVGSVHQVHDLLFDDKLSDYQRAVEISGGINALYCDYFDKQLELIETFHPAVVGHFDLIRIHDPDYSQRWDVPEIRQRAFRNLDRINALGLILDLNTRALSKGAGEPYISAPLLRYAVAQGMRIAPGDDSHSLDTVGAHLQSGVEFLTAMGGHTNWPKPTMGRHKPSREPSREPTPQQAPVDPG